MTETEQLEQDAETLVGNWDEIAPLIAAVQRRTGLTKTQALLVWLGSQPDDDEPEPWEA